MGLKAKLEKIENSKKAQNSKKENEQVMWLEKAYSKNNKWANSKVYSK